jgi:hypothetical protein
MKTRVLVYAALALGCQSPAMKSPARPAPAPSVAEKSETAPRASTKADSLMAVITVSRPRELQRWLKTLLDPKSEVAILTQIELEALAPQFLSEPIDQLIDFEQPVHVGLVAPDGDQMVVSLAAKPSFEYARRKLAEGLRLTRVVPGVYEIEPQAQKVACELRRAPAEKARFVCGQDRQQVAEHAAHLMNVAAAGRNSGLVRFESSRFLQSKVLSKVPDSDDDPVSRYFDQLRTGLVQDMVSNVLELHLTKDGIEIGVENRFDKSHSLLSTLVVSSVAQPSSAAAGYWRLPKDSLTAMHFAGGDPQKTRAAAAPFFDGWVKLDHPEFDDASRAELGKQMGRIFFTGGPLDFAFGMDLAKSEQALTAYEAKRASFDKTQLALAGWMLIGVEQSSSDLHDAIRKSDEAEAQGGKSAQAAGRAAAAAPESERFDSTTLEKKLPAGARLPKGSVYWVTTHTPNPNYRPKDDTSPPPGSLHQTHTYLVPDGSRSWIAHSKDERLARKKVIEVLAGKSTLTPTGALQPLASMNGIGFGFFTTAALSGASMQVESEAELAEARETLNKALGFKEARNVPLIFELQNRAEKGATVVRFEVSVPQSVVQAFADAPPID